MHLGEQAGGVSWMEQVQGSLAAPRMVFPREGVRVCAHELAQVHAHACALPELADSCGETSEQ